MNKKVVVVAVGLILLIIIIAVVIAVVLTQKKKSSDDSPDNSSSSDSSDYSDDDAAETPADVTYTVRAGDDISKIANYFYGDGNRNLEVAAANNLAAPYIIQVGQTLTIKSPLRSEQKYTVVAGDDITKIAEKFYNNDYTKNTYIAYTNNLTSPYVIYPGQVLSIFV